jgi:hypothetical protein
MVTVGDRPAPAVESLPRVETEANPRPNQAATHPVAMATHLSQLLRLGFDQAGEGLQLQGY